MKKGFTLVEMLGVITVIALLALIIFPIVNNQLNDNKEKLYDIQINNIENAAKSYGADNIHLLPTEDNGEFKITLNTLVEEGYIDDGLTDPITQEAFPSDMEIIITNEDGNLNYMVMD